MKIERIRVAGFKSVADITLTGLTPYSVFAGPNGAGKSNLMDALSFVQAVIELGAAKAIRKFGGFANMHCYKFRKDRAKTFEFGIEISFNDEPIEYDLKIHDLKRQPVVEERLSIAGEPVISRKPGDTVFLKNAGAERSIQGLPKDFPALMFAHRKTPLHQFLTNLQLFRFDPLGAKEPASSSADSSELDPQGHNVAAMLATLESDPDLRGQIIDWIELIVPGMQELKTERQRLDGRTVIKFKEEGTKAHFPANLISDGTIYSLCIMTAVLTRTKGCGLTIIEEPERGIHPKAISELVSLMRDNSTPSHPIFVTTHSESVVRASRLDELWMVNKDGGKTLAKNAASDGGDPGGIPLDTAWLMNVFNGGLPW